MSNIIPCKRFMMNAMGRGLVYLGLLVVVIGLIVMLGERAGIRLGRLPGDIVYKNKNTTVYFPLVTSILVSVILSLVMWLFNRR